MTSLVCAKPSTPQWRAIMDEKIKEVMGLVGKLCHLERTVGRAIGSGSDECYEIEVEANLAHADLESKLREMVPVWLPIESAEKPAIGANGFGERVLLLVDCGDGTLKSTKIGWWCDKWMMDTGGSVKENGYRATHWMPLPKEPS